MTDLGRRASEFSGELGPGATISKMEIARPGASDGEAMTALRSSRERRGPVLGASACPQARSVMVTSPVSHG